MTSIKAKEEQDADKERADQNARRRYFFGTLLPGASPDDGDRRAAGDRRLCCSDRAVCEPAALAHRAHLLVLRTASQESFARLSDLLRRLSFLLQFLL